ncbi:mucin-1-like [Penaeus japonicus]|uniref:mucin-1-like n=1 Tax=Penaeus japonicus TaxID=27405 RepID=UPI001C70B0DB|nr:mucin-1-like [Penaeus japonicus]
MADPPTSPAHLFSAQQCNGKMQQSSATAGRLCNKRTPSPPPEQHRTCRLAPGSARGAPPGATPPTPLPPPFVQQVASKIREHSRNRGASADKTKPPVHKPAITVDRLRANGPHRYHLPSSYACVNAAQRHEANAAPQSRSEPRDSTPRRPAAPPSRPRKQSPRRQPVFRESRPRRGGITRATADGMGNVATAWGSPVTSRDVASTYDVCVLAVNTQNPRTQHARRIYALALHAGGVRSFPMPISLSSPSIPSSVPPSTGHHTSMLMSLPVTESRSPSNQDKLGALCALNSRAYMDADVAAPPATTISPAIAPTIASTFALAPAIAPAIALAPTTALTTAPALAWLGHKTGPTRASSPTDPPPPKSLMSLPRVV